MRNIFYFIILSIMVAGNCQYGYAQTRFDIPDRIPHYASYLYLEDCLAAVDRVAYIEKRIKEIVDTFAQKRERSFLNPNSQAVKDTGLLCSKRWTVDSVDAKLMKQWGEDFMALGRSAEVKSMYKHYIDSIPKSQVLSARGEVLNLFQQYLDEDLLDDYLTFWLEHNNEIPVDSFPLRFTSLLFKIVTWITLWEPERAASELNEYIEYVASVPEEKRTSPYVSAMAERFFPNALVVKEPSILEKITESTAAYSEYVKDLWKKIGHGNEYISPIDSSAPKLINKWVYGPKLRGDGKLAVKKLSPESVSLPQNGKVNLITFIEGGCHELSPTETGRNLLMRLNAAIEGDRSPDNLCARTVAAINRIKKTHPDIEVTVVTKSFGYFGSGLVPSPEEEGEILAKYFVENYGLNAYVAVSETENFKLSGLDQRRIDLPTENDDNYQIAGRRNSAHANVILVDPEGKIFYSGLIVLDDGENIARNLIGAVLKRSQLKSEQ